MSAFRKAFASLLTAIVLIAGPVPTPASAAPILGPGSATTDMGQAFPLQFALDQSGLSEGYVSGVTDFDAYVATATHTSNPGNDWVATMMTGQVTFSLGEVLLVDRAAVWNFGTGTGDPAFAIRDILLQASVDLINFVDLGNYTLTNPGGAPSTLAQVLSFSPINAAFIRMNVLSTYGQNAALGEIAFSIVPEPASVTLLAIGLLGLGLSQRLRH